MHYNTILNRFGFDITNFINKPLNVIEGSNGFICEVEECINKSSDVFLNTPL